MFVENTSSVGKRTYFIPMTDFNVTGYTNPAVGGAVTASATDGTRVIPRGLAFADGTKLYACATVRMPKSWNAGAVTLELAVETSSGTGAAVFGAQAIAISGTDSTDIALPTATEATVTIAAAYTPVVVSLAMTPSNTPAKSDYLFIQIYRDPANAADTSTATMRLIGATVIYNVDAEKDD